MNSTATRPTSAFQHAENVKTIFDPLPFKSGLTVENRIFRSKMSGMFDDYSGHGGNARLNWEELFARGGVGCIISSYCPVTVEGRILTRYAMIDHDDKIPFWEEVGRRVHRHQSCKFILQLSHSGRQQDLGGFENLYRRPPSSTGKRDFFHGILCRRMDWKEIARTVKLFADGAVRAQKAGLDGVELHGANGYLITQFLSYTVYYDAEHYTEAGLDWVDDSSLKGVLLRHYPSLARTGLSNVENAFEPWDTDPAQLNDKSRHPLMHGGIDPLIAPKLSS
jgi:hypothetical protein